MDLLVQLAKLFPESATGRTATEDVMILQSDKKFMDHLAATTPVTRFATLSPIPGFARWLDGQPAEPHDSLLAACARYLLTAKRGRQPLDPVARFHLGAGARLERLNPGGDTSVRGLKRYRGITANYLYERDDLAENQAAFDRGEVVASPAVTSLLTDP